MKIGDPRRFGVALRRAVWSDAALALLPGGGMAFGWNDGGCLLLADALQQLLGRQADLLAIVGRGTLLGQHFLVRVDRWHLDADGACLEATLLRRWETTELVWAPRLVRASVADLSPGTPRNPALSAGIAAYLAGALASSSARPGRNQP